MSHKRHVQDRPDEIQVRNPKSITHKLKEAFWKKFLMFEFQLTMHRPSLILNLNTYQSDFSHKNNERVTKNSKYQTQE